MRTKKVDLSTYNLLKIQFTNGKKAEKTGIEILICAYILMTT